MSIQLYRHPDKVRLPHIEEWVEDYEYTIRHGIQVPRRERHPAWLEAETLYRSIMAECENAKYNRNNIQSNRPTVSHSK
ncbi:MAG: hypothetical protein GY775_15060 [Candidatus Scalindua sp.]|nr:hypothetical protein [Candidatus Scalindua sp.]